MTAILGSSSSLRGVPVLGAGIRTRWFSVPKLRRPQHEPVSTPRSAANYRSRLPRYHPLADRTVHEAPGRVDGVHGKMELDGTGARPAGRSSPYAAGSQAAHDVPFREDDHQQRRYTTEQPEGEQLPP